MRRSRRGLAGLVLAVLSGALVVTGCGAGGHAGARPASTTRTRLTASVSPVRLRRAATRTSHCYASPKACGFPDPSAAFPSSAYVGPHDASGPVSCGSLPVRRGLVTLRRAGSTFANVDVQGRIVIVAPNVTIDNVCVAWNASGNTNNPPAVEFEATGGRVLDSDVGGANRTDESTQIALGENTNTGYRLYASHDKLNNCSECVHNDGWTVRDSYVIANGRPCGSYSGTHCVGGIDHVEAIYCDTGSFTIEHDTLIDPDPQTAAVFCNTDNGGAQEPCANQLTIADTLLIGGGFTIYGCSNGVPVGTSHMTVTDNRFARCVAHPVYQPSTGGSTCSHENVASRGDDGLYPYGGYYGWEADSYCPKAGGQVWSGNVWDNDNAPVRCVQDH